MKKVVIFTTAYLPYIGGAEIAVKEITSRLPDYSFDVFTARLDRKLPKFEQIENVNVYRLGLGYFFDKYWLAFLGHHYALRKNKMHSYDFVWGIMASFGGLAARNFKKKKRHIPFLLTLQEGDELDQIEKKGRLLFGAFEGIFRQADHIQAISQYLGKWADRMGAKCQISVVPNGVNDTNLNEVLPKKVFPTGITIITTSRLVHKNGIDTLIKSLQFLPDNYQLLIVGEGKEKIQLERLVTDLNLNSRVNFYGSVSPDEVNSLLLGADIFCRPSRSEGLGNSFLEAMAIGIPIIGTMVGGIPDFLKDKQTGFVVPVDGHEAIAETCKYIMNLENKEKVKDVIDDALVLIKNQYLWNNISLKMREIFTLISP